MPFNASSSSLVAVLILTAAIALLSSANSRPTSSNSLFIVISPKVGLRYDCTTTPGRHVGCRVEINNAPYSHQLTENTVRVGTRKNPALMSAHHSPQHSA